MNTEELTPPVSDNDHTVGPSSARVTLVQYGDYQCPYTILSHWQIELLLKNFPKDLRFVFRHFPLQKKHPLAMRAAEAVEAAAAQGKFWEMHRALLKQQYSLGWESIREAAAAFNLDLPGFESDVLDHVHRRKIQEQINSGVRSGVESTPAYFVNGYAYLGQDDYDTLAREIQSIITKRS